MKATYDWMEEATLLYTSAVVGLQCKYLGVYTVVELAVHVPESAWLLLAEVKEEGCLVCTKTRSNPTQFLHENEDF